ncbi:hypothetical protein K505DRAFT_407775 [Melanomma pulvis-pyrius CBS 109.77]|uniref:Guanine nucleotide-exchange factor SEC12 n=1 Tax=Melanomma pulvis-pyrius CBS 109.77 TaxID=1314802 RepID=A0A6A6XCD3_9PLEO|nr:hypothetical protein K505DRAFT_407775 [Melanomma pulvis-pyrius CBS 109.77]
MSAPTISKASVSYPIFSATFDRSGHLFVGGGGGAGRSGIPNKITCFDVNSRAPNLEPFAEIDLSRDEDSVTCLANLATRHGVILYAGINSTEEERLKDKNEHFRSFEVVFPKNQKSSNANQEKKPQGKVTLLNKTSLFTPPTSASAKKEVYQRLVRLSPSKPIPGHKRIGAIASSLAGDENEIVILDASIVPPTRIKRIALHKGHEANDVDILEPENGHFKVAYCTDYEVYIQDLHYDFGKKKLQGDEVASRKVFSIPIPDAPGKKGRNKLRCIKWLSPDHVLLLTNLPNRSGVELQVLRLPSTPSIGSISTRKRLPRHVIAAVDMDVCWLDSDGAGDYQIVVAVGGIDISLVVLTIDYHAHSLGSIHQYAVYRDVHDLQMTKLALSPFFSPWASPESSPTKRPGHQWLRLASTSLGNTISVETFQLHPVSTGPRARYQLSSAKSRYMAKGATYTVFAIVLAVVALLMQSLLDPEGNLTDRLVPQSLRNSAGISPPGAMGDELRFPGAKMVPNAVKAPVVRTTHRIRDLLHLHHSQDAEQKAVVIHHDPDTDSSLSTEVHADTDEVVKRHTEAKKWEELSHAEQKRWKEKLTGAGMWAVEEGETILKGIFFSQAGNFVGQIAQGVING